MYPWETSPIALKMSRASGTPDSLIVYPDGFMSSEVWRKNAVSHLALVCLCLLFVLILPFPGSLKSPLVSGIFSLWSYLDMVIKSPLCLLFNKLSRWSTLKHSFLQAFGLFYVALSQPWLCIGGVLMAELNKGTATTSPYPHPAGEHSPGVRVRKLWSASVRFSSCRPLASQILQTIQLIKRKERL